MHFITSLKPWSRILERFTEDLNLRGIFKHKFYLILRNFG